MKLIATKPLTYRTRRMLPGDSFDCDPRHVKIWLGLKKARDPNKRDRVVIPRAPAELVARVAEAAPVEEDQTELALAAEADTELSALREEAEKLGIEIGARWGAKRIRAAIEDAKAPDTHAE